MIIPLDPIARRIVGIMALVAVLALIMVFVTMCSTRQQLSRQDAQTARATGKALDRVADQTPIIRQEQKAKENEVAAIEGSDTRLPDGYGAALERVRRERHQNP